MLLEHLRAFQQLKGTDTVYMVAQITCSLAETLPANSAGHRILQPSGSFTSRKPVV